MAHHVPRPRSSGHGVGGDLVSTLVRIAFLVRLIALAFAVISLSVAEPDLLATALFCVLAVNSHLGLQRPSVRAAVVRRPALALPDAVTVALIPLLVGVDSPLAVIAVSSALLLGVLFVVRSSIPLVALLVTAFAIAPQGGGLWAVDRFIFPVTLLSIWAMGVAFRRMAEQREEAERESAAARAAATAAQERLRLARDLHDTVAKSVQGVALMASALPGWLERDPEVARRHAAMVASSAREAVTAARSLLTSLRLDDPARPLDEVLEELGCRWQSDRGLRVVRDLEPVAKLDPGRRHELVCAISEALENVARHAPGSSVVLTLRDCGDGALAVVADDGPGFLATREQEALADGHYGLTGMRERMAVAGGTAMVDSCPGAGTQVRLFIPYVMPSTDRLQVEEVVT